MRVAFVSREMYPFTNGGIGQFVTACARLLSRIAEVTVVTTSLFEAEYERLRRAGDPRLPDAVRIAFVPEPTLEESSAWYHIMHVYSARVLERLRELYPDEPPDLIEFPDYLGEGFVTLQAAAAMDPFLATTRVCVRVHTTAEICELLNGYRKPDLPSRAVHEFERYSLAHADRVIWQGGDILGTYQRFYGTRGIASPTRVRYPYFGALGSVEQDADFDPSGSLELLYVGRLERRKGVQNLIRAVTGLARDDFHLTLVGGDTATGPLGVSMRELLELGAAEDPRITFLDAMDRGAVGEAIRQHHVVLVPSLWECWPYAALEPFHLNRPVLGTPVGGLTEMVQAGASGWLAGACDPTSLEATIAQVLCARDELAELVRAGRPQARARALCDDQEILDDYQRLMRGELVRTVSPGRRRGNPPLVSAIVPYYRASRFARETIASLVAQTYPRIEIVMVNDGSFEDDDWLVAELSAEIPLIVVSQMNQGLGAARNLGIAQSRGRYVFPLDADNVAAPTFVERCVEILECRPEVAYATSWSRYIEEDGTPREGPNLGYEPLGNQSALIDEENVAGDAAAIVRRSLFDAGFRYSDELTSYEDWQFYRELAQAGHLGVVVPERLIRYRVRDDSMQALIAQPSRQRLVGEMQAHLNEKAMQWTSSNV